MTESAVRSRIASDPFLAFSGPSRALFFSFFLECGSRAPVPGNAILWNGAPVGILACSAAHRGSRAAALHPLRGDSFAKAHFSTAATSPFQNSRVSLTHEDHGRPQSSCGSPQEGTSSPHARVAPIIRTASRFQVTLAWSTGEILTASIKPVRAFPVPTSPSLFVPTNWP